MSDDSVPPTITPPPAPAQGLIARVQAILTKPAETWDVIAAEPSDIKSIYMGYILPLAAIGPVATAIGGMVVGHGAFGITYHVSPVLAVVGGIVSYVMSLIMVYVIALIVDALAPSFDGQKDKLAAFKLSAYGMTAGWVAAIVGILPALSIIAIIGALYGLYIIYLGLPKLMKNPKEKTIVYMIVIAVIAIVASFIMGAVGGAVTGSAALMSGDFGRGHINEASDGKVSGSVSLPGLGKVDLGKMEAAASSMEAQASAIQNGTATPVKVADPAALMALMPQSFMGAARTDDSTSSGDVGGLSGSNAKARYTIGDGYVDLSIADTGGLAGFGGMLNAVNVNASSSSAGGYSKISSEGDRKITEEYHTDSKSGSYTVLVNGRIAVSADGSNVDMATLKAIVGSVNISQAEALAQ